MRGDLNLLGLYVPPFLLCSFLGWASAKLLRRKLVATGFYKRVWHPALFDICLIVIFTVLILEGFRMVTSWT